MIPLVVEEGMLKDRLVALVLFERECVPAYQAKWGIENFFRRTFPAECICSVFLIVGTITAVSFLFPVCEMIATD